MTGQVNLTTDVGLPSYGPTMFKTERNQCEVHCGMCGKVIYVDEDTVDFVTEAINSGLDDPFRCNLCKEEYDDLSYEG